MARHNAVEALSFEVLVDGDETGFYLIYIILKVEKVLLGGLGLRQVSF
jgi:hypothetical protein